MTKNNTTEWKEKIRFAMAHIEGSDASDVDNMCSLFESLLTQDRKDTLESVRRIADGIEEYIEAKDNDTHRKMWQQDFAPSPRQQ